MACGPPLPSNRDAWNYYLFKFEALKRARCSRLVKCGVFIVYFYLSWGCFVRGVDGFLVARELNRQSIHTVCLARAMPTVYSVVLVGSKRKVVGNVGVLAILD